MAKKKKKLDDAAWMWISQPSVPGISSSPLPGLIPIRNLPAIYTTGGDAETWSYIEGDTTIKEMPIEGFTRAMFEYAYLAALDPTNLPEGAVWAGTLGIGYRWGLLIAIAKGILIGAPLLAIIDPQDRWAGGLDETSTYQRIVPPAVAGVSGAHPNLNKDILMGAGSWGSVV
jgi:hypothetical protein